LKGFAEGLQSGINTALKMKVLKLQKEELELQKKQLELLEELIYLQNESNKINHLLDIGMNQNDVMSVITFDPIYEDSSQILYKNADDYLVACLFFENQLIAWDLITSKKESFLFDTYVIILAQRQSLDYPDSLYLSLVECYLSMISLYYF